MKDAQCPGCYSQSFEHDDDGCQNSLCAKGYCGCKLTPAEIDAVLAMRANNLAVPVESRADTRNSGWSIAPAGDGKKPGPTPLVDGLRNHAEGEAGVLAQAELLEAADEIERLRTAITTTLALAGCAHLADDHGHQRCDALPTQHDRGGFRHGYERPRMLDALAAAVGDDA